MQLMFNNSSWEFWISNSNFYFQPGLTWPLRASRFSPSFLPSGAIFSVRGYAIIAPKLHLRSLCSLCSSTIFDFLFKIMLGRFGYPEFIVGTLRLLPVPNLFNPDGEALGNLAESCFKLKCFIQTSNEIGHHFSILSSQQVEGLTLSEKFANWRDKLCWIERQLNNYQEEINKISFRLYGVDGKDREEIENMLSIQTKMENDEIFDLDKEPQIDIISTNLVAFAQDQVSYVIGCNFGRWDVRMIERNHHQLLPLDQFDPLPICSPAMLQGDDGLPLRQSPPDYPLGMVEDGILVDDPDHSDDMVRRGRYVLEVIWKDRADAIEKEACEILGVKELRDYFRKPGKGGFWDVHISRYSKSRRKAPIYWLLQSSKKNYALWLYYHRLDKDLLFKALVNYVEPKIRLETSRLETLRSQKATAGDSGKEGKRLAKEAERQEDFLSELRDFEDKLRRAANLHLEPDLNDGVVLNIAPLHELVPWKEAKNYWNELLAGKYEWPAIGQQLRQNGRVKC